MAIILIVEDDEIVLQVSCKALERAGHCIYCAKSGDEAEEISATLPCVDVLIVDHRVPPDSGRKIAERLLLKHSTAKVMHFSGYSRSMLEQEGSLVPGAAFLQKPFRAKELQDSITALLGNFR